MTGDRKMEKMVYRQEGDDNQLGTLLEGYLYGLGEVCHSLYGPRGEVAMYQAIGSYFLHYLEEKMNIAFTDSDPWKRYCHIIEVFTKYGFYSHVELEKLSGNKYWMLETGQYAGNVWEEQKAWQRGTPPCPLWSVILHSLAEINYTVILDEVKFIKNSNGYESTFHFERIPQTGEGVLEKARKEIRSALIPICASCKKIRENNGNWVDPENYFKEHFEANFTHGFCSVCMKKLYPGVYEKMDSETDKQQISYSAHIFERRSGMDRRRITDRRADPESRSLVSKGKVTEITAGRERRSGLERRSNIERRVAISVQ
jgi:hypothetical protein